MNLLHFRKALVTSTSTIKFVARACEIPLLSANYDIYVQAEETIC